MVNKPTISIIIPTFNRPDTLEDCLKNLAALNLPRKRTQVLVVNDGGNIHTTALLKRFNPFYCFKIYNQKRGGPARARNRGAAVAEGKHLVFLDDDCRVPENWFVNLEAAIKEHPDAIIGGRIINGLSSNPYAAASQALIDYICAYQDNFERNHSFFTTNNLIVPAAAFNLIGGFSSRYPFAGEDREMCYRWRRTGRKLIYVPDLVVRHYHHMDLAAFCYQHYRYGRGTLRYHLNRARYESRRHIRLEPLKFYIGLLVFNESGCRPAVRVARLFLMLTSQLATAVGFMSLLLNRRLST